MKRILWLLVLLAAISLHAAPLQADDGFYVVAVRSSVGTKITSLPYTIDAPGYYFLVDNLSYNIGNGITVNSDNVTIDLMGFTLTGPGVASNYCGIYMDGRNNVEIRNGTVTGWFKGIAEDGDGAAGHRMIGVRAAKNQFGIYLHGTNHLIKGCLATQGNFGSGSGLIILGGGTISDCTSMNFTTSNPAVDNSGYGILIGSGTVSRNLVVFCHDNGSTGATGIKATGTTTISYNQVSQCRTGISSSGGGSIIGNVVLGDSYGFNGIIPSTDINTPNVLDQNTSSGNYTSNYGPGSAATVWGLNGG